ncbi:MAG: PaaI family thioesterase [Alphaproteobacteria bacterium]|nr:PaaI family thioesterase [Alphaproteobacteria bacterium]
MARKKEGQGTGAGRFVPMASFARMVGFRVLKWERDRAELELKVGPRHINRGGFVHGGVLMTLLDAACGYAGTYHEPDEPPRLGHSVSITTSFISNVSKGTLRTVGYKTGGGSRLFFARSEVHGPDGRILATAQCVFRYRSAEAAEQALKRARRAKRPSGPER